MDGSAIRSCWHNLTALHINKFLYLARKVFLFHFSCNSCFFFFFHFSNFQKLSSYLSLPGVGWHLKHYYRDGVCNSVVYKSPLFLLILLRVRAANRSLHFWCFRRVIRTQICVLASKLLVKFLPGVRESRNGLTAHCRGKCGVRWYRVCPVPQ